MVLKESRREVKSRIEISETVDRKSTKLNTSERSMLVKNCWLQTYVIQMRRRMRVDAGTGWGEGKGPTEMKAGPSLLSPPTLEG